MHLPYLLIDNPFNFIFQKYHIKTLPFISLHKSVGDERRLLHPGCNKWSWRDLSLGRLILMPIYAKNTCCTFLHTSFPLFHQSKHISLHNRENNLKHTSFAPFCIKFKKITKGSRKNSKLFMSNKSKFEITIHFERRNWSNDANLRKTRQQWKIDHVSCTNFASCGHDATRKNLELYSIKILKVYFDINKIINLGYYLSYFFKRFLRLRFYFNEFIY